MRKLNVSNFKFKHSIQVKVLNIKRYLRPHVIKFDQCACHHTKWVELANIRISPLNIWLETTNPKSPRKTCQRHMIERYENILKQTKWRHKLLPRSLDYVYFAKLLFVWLTMGSKYFKGQIEICTLLQLPQYMHLFSTEHGFNQDSFHFRAILNSSLQIQLTQVQR